jgi:hypothetical protein
MKAIFTKDGLLIPKEELERWGEVIVEERPYQVIIRPKSVTLLTYGAAAGKHEWVDQFLEDLEAGGAVIDDGEPPTELHDE